MKALVFVAVALVSALPLAAQVGHEPAKSPYKDLEYTQEITLLGGYLRARHDPANAAPLSRPMAGVRYEITVAGPLALSSEVTAGFGHRNLIEPLKPKATRDIGIQNSGVYSGDFALAMNLPGQRSWHDLVPQLRAGVGLVTSRAKDDSSGFAFGTKFAWVYGAGLKFVPSGSRIQLRADMTDRLFKLTYPDTYYRLASDNTAVVDATTPRDFYTHHLGLTLGLSYLFGR
ncbi:MAG: hypothetical protein JWM95_3546 [Gemmatimonadetes bacterium]|nr:hypothetical protein [Gemmatimonadota bacterium]